MAWAITTAPAPSLDSGIVTLPSSLTAVPNLTTTTTTVYPMGMHFCNANDDDVQVTVTDNSGAKFLDAVNVPAHGVLEIQLSFPPLVGLKWFASTAAGVTGKIWGYQ